MWMNNKSIAYFGYSWAAIPPHCLNALGIKGWLLLVQAFVGKAYIALLGLKNAGHVHLGEGKVKGMREVREGEEGEGG